MQNLLDYRDWMRTRLGIPTTLSLGLPGAKAGEESPIVSEPNNWTLDNFITNACSIANQHFGITGSSSIQSFPLDAADASQQGPLSINLGSLPGIRRRGIVSIRRAWWNDGIDPPTRLDPVILSMLDNRRDPYMADTPSTPRRFAIEGYTLFLDPANYSAGAFQYMATTGTLAPQNEVDCFEGIPEIYDPCLLYIALVEYGKSLPRDAEMAARAGAFTSDAAAGLERLGAWFATNNEEAQPAVFFDARPMRRNWYAYRR